MQFRLWVVGLLLTGCGALPGNDAPRSLSGGLFAPGRSLARSTAAALAAPPATPVEPIQPKTESCETLLAEVARAPALPGAPKLDRSRAEMLARAKGEPVLFERAPEWSESKSPVIRAYRRALAKARFPWETLRQIRDRFQYAPKIGRQVLLRDGYLYAETADLGWALWDSVRLEHLFDEPELVIERGSEHLTVTRDPNGRYVYAEGNEKGKPARLLLFDRVGIRGQDLGAPLHRDVRSLSHQLGFERMKVVRQTRDHILAELRYGGTWSRAVIAAKGSQLSLVCELPRDGNAKALARARTEAERHERIVSALRTAMLSMVYEELPFDEPKTEWGQQDGHLMNHWLAAYRDREPSFFFQGDRYSVFTSTGAPMPPQVCIDFITDTFERASGSWWRREGQPPGRSEGGIDFDGILGKDRRKVTAFLAYAKGHPERFELEELPTKQQLPYVFKRFFYRHLERQADDYTPGTIVVIRGRAPWDHFNAVHYHSFFVYEADPITGMPLLLAGNAGKPRIQSWESVMSRAPQRSIRYRIHANLAWLDASIPKTGGGNRTAPALMSVF